ILPHEDYCELIRGLFPRCPDVELEQARLRLQLWDCYLTQKVFEVATHARLDLDVKDTNDHRFSPFPTSTEVVKRNRTTTMEHRLWTYCSPGQNQPTQMSSAIRAAALAAPSCSTSRYSTLRPTSSAIAAAMTSGVTCSKSMQRP